MVAVESTRTIREIKEQYEKYEKFVGRVFFPLSIFIFVFVPYRDHLSAPITICDEG